MCIRDSVRSHRTYVGLYTLCLCSQYLRQINYNLTIQPLHNGVLAETRLKKSCKMRSNRCMCRVRTSSIDVSIGCCLQITSILLCLFAQTNMQGRVAVVVVVVVVVVVLVVVVVAAVAACYVFYLVVMMIPNALRNYSVAEQSKELAAPNEWLDTPATSAS